LGSHDGSWDVGGVEVNLASFLWARASGSGPSWWHSTLTMSSLAIFGAAYPIPNAALMPLHI
jgi:hypothetical protein